MGLVSGDAGKGFREAAGSSGEVAEGIVRGTLGSQGVSKAQRVSSAM